MPTTSLPSGHIPSPTLVYSTPLAGLNPDLLKLSSTECWIITTVRPTAVASCKPVPPDQTIQTTGFQPGHSYCTSTGISPANLLKYSMGLIQRLGIVLTNDVAWFFTTVRTKFWTGKIAIFAHAVVRGNAAHAWVRTLTLSATPSRKAVPTVPAGSLCSGEP